MASYTRPVRLLAYRVIYILAVLIIVYFSAVQESESAEYRAFQRHYADLFKSIGDTTSLAAELYSAGLLSRETRKRIYSRTLVESDKMTCELLDATETAIRQDPSNYHKFVEALEKDSSMQHLCGKLRSTCGECDNVCLSKSKYM